MLNAIFAGLAGALLAPFTFSLNKRLAPWLIALVPAGLFAYFLQFLGFVTSGEVIEVVYQWVPDLNVGLSFRMDGLALMFALLVTGIGTLVVIYAGGYMADYEKQGRFFLFLLVFLSAMLGVVLSGDLLTLFVFWELTSFSSFLLIGFETKKPEARASALQAFLVTGGGGLALMGGLVMLGIAGGSFQMSELFQSVAQAEAHPFFVPALLLILLGAFTKSAQFPFHFWLPNAMAAPTPVSAYLHSATMVKAGIYLMARLYPVFHESVWWQVVVSGIGLVTMLLGAFLALNSTDLKRILAYSTVSSLGTMTLLLGLGIDEAAKAAMVFLLAHALYKGALFMIAGAIDHETGTRDVIRLSGLRYYMPILTVVSIVAAISLSGLGPVLSFIGKELLFEAVLASPSITYFGLPAVVISSAVSVALALILVIKPFWGEKEAYSHPLHDPPASLWLGPAILGLAGLGLGLLPGVAAKWLVEPAVRAVVDGPATVKLSLWHGFNPALLMSAIAIALGFVLYRVWDFWRNQSTRVMRYFQWGPEAFYGWSLIALNWVASASTRILQNGYLRTYLLIVISSTVALAGWILVFQGGFHWPEQVTEIYFYEVGLAGLIIAASLMVIRSPSRLSAITGLGVVGYSIALLFLQFGAPDLAMTQFLIESITVILFVFTFYHLPRFESRSAPGPRLFHATIAILVGLMMGGLVLSAVQLNLYPSISEYFLESAVSLAHGRNIVNVILVDFRGLDTLGEITVLAVAAAGVYAILRYRRKEHP